MSKPKLATENLDRSPDLTLVKGETKVPMVALKSSIGIGQPMEHGTNSLRVFNELQANVLASHWEKFSRAKWEGTVTFSRLFSLLPQGFMVAKTDESPQDEHLTFVAIRHDADNEIDAAIIINAYSLSLIHI